MQFLFAINFFVLASALHLSLLIIFLLELSDLRGQSVLEHCRCGVAKCPPDAHRLQFPSSPQHWPCWLRLMGLGETVVQNPSVPIFSQKQICILTHAIKVQTFDNGKKFEGALRTEDWIFTRSFVSSCIIYYYYYASASVEESRWATHPFLQCTYPELVGKLNIFAMSYLVISENSW